VYGHNRCFFTCETEINFWRASRIS